LDWALLKEDVSRDNIVKLDRMAILILEIFISSLC